MNDQLILERYRLIERLALGGSAEVWRARDEQLDRQVAVKRLHPHLLPDEASRRRLAAEARAAASLSHPVIVGVYDVDATGDAPAIVMELVDGESLSARIDREGALDSRSAAATTADVAEALYHAHQRGVIHRDVKPGNVLLARDGRTRLVDFGIAHSLAESAERLTVTGTVIGTLRAMAPEQLAAGPITPRTDLYGLGVVLYEALTGRTPYATGSPLALAEAQRAGHVDLQGLDPGLAAIVTACLAWDPAQRPLHAGALAAALRDWLAGDPAAALAMAPAPSAATPVDTQAITQPIPMAALPAASAASGPMPSEPASRKHRRRPLAILGALAILLLVAAAAAVATGFRPGNAAGSPPTPSPTVAPTPTVAPEWLAGLVEKVAKDCGEAIAAEWEASMSAMTEAEAKDHAEAQVDACKASDDDDGNGRGGGNGNRGGGNDD